MRTVLYNISLSFIFSSFIFGCSGFNSITVAEKVLQPIENLCKEGTVLQTYKSINGITDYFCVKESEECVEQEVENPRTPCIKEGVYKTVYKNGKTRYITTFKNNEINGQLEQYTEDGFLYWRAIYRNGLHNGTEEIWDTVTKEIILYAEYSNGKKHGETRTYDANGKLSTKSFWVNGLLMQSNDFYYFSSPKIVRNTERKYNYFLNYPLVIVEETVCENGKEVSADVYIK